jgi:hypothetical protein
MQLKERDGIACDLCSTSYKEDFTYYSFDIRLLNVNDDIRPSLNSIFMHNVIFSLDVCEKCMAEIAETIKKKHQPLRKGICCDLTGKIMNGTFEYYHCQVIKAIVRMTGQPNVCVNCNYQTQNEDKLCPQCDGNEFLRLASVQSDDRYVDLDISEEAYKELVDKAMNVRKIAGEWTTTT